MAAHHGNGIFGTAAPRSARALLVVAALLVGGAAAFPLWNLTMFAPQYPHGLTLDIYAYRLEGGNGGQDLEEINVLNHYIGMRALAPEGFTEFRWMPYALGALAAALLASAAVGKLRFLAATLLGFVAFGGVSLWSFATKLYSYGHDLDPGAPVRVDPFMPPVFGGQQIANFEVYSYPMLGSYAFTAVGAALVLALVLTARAGRRGVGRLDGAPEAAAGAAAR
jgi:copper chaperone NosL